MSQDAKRLVAEGQLSALPMPMGEAGWARDIRAKARARLLDMGAPARRDEYWKYTDPKAFADVAPLADSTEAPQSVNPFGAIPAHSVRFVNGRLRTDLSDTLGGDGWAASPLSEALAQDLSIARELFGTLEVQGQEKVDRPLAILNTATAGEGLMLQVSGAAGTLHLHYDQIGAGTSMLRHLVRVESGASVTILETGDAANTVFEIDVADDGECHHVRVQSASTNATASHMFAQLGARSQFKTFTLTADGSLTRNEVVMAFNGDEASGHIAGAVLAQGDSHIDNTVFVTHDAVACESRQVFKNVLSDKARGIFQGKIFVKEGAQKTDGYQISQAVLLTDGAEFSAKPELEIYADDVACSHGSTTGALDPTAMFYLQSRGVLRAEAEAMLIAAFADEAIEEIADPEIAECIRAAVAGWMAGRG